MITNYKNKTPRIHASAYIAPNATVIGDIEIGENSSIWFGAVVRGDVNYIKIGKNTNIQDNSVVHVTADTYPIIIGDNVTIGHNAVVHGCRIGNNTLIGIGAIILDGAEIGKNSIIAAGAVVKEGAKVEDNSLWAGVPAKKIRELTQENIELIKLRARNYVEHCRDYKGPFQ